jgi:hypothetical protein
MSDNLGINATDGSNATIGGGTTISPPAGNLSTSLDEVWLHDFYKECGREVTLAYTTLNQMKNWAMVIAAAAVSGLAFGSKSPEYPTPIMFAGSVIVYTFILRFFIRAIICYVNLVRWNRLQTDCVQAKLLPDKRTGKTSQDLMEKLRDDLQHYYFEWLSPISRKEQIFQNLKLGFYLLFGLSLFFLIWGAVVLWQQYLVKGLTTFAFLNTVLEATDFYRSNYFDDVRASEKRKVGKHDHVFPVPASRGGFMLGWILNIAVSTVVATWPHLSAALLRFWCK